MDQVVLDKAESLLLRAIEGIETSGEFVIDQAPEVINELLRWHTIESLIYFSSGILLILLFPIAFYLLHKEVQRRKARAPYGEPEVMYAIFSPILGFAEIMAIIVILENLEWLQILIAPKLYLLEYAAKLM
jgi:hypothetical protein